MAKAKKQDELKEELEQPEEDVKEELEQPEEEPAKPSGVEGLAVEFKGISESEEFKIGRAAPVVNNPESTMFIIRN